MLNHLENCEIPEFQSQIILQILVFVHHREEFQTLMIFWEWKNNHLEIIYKLK